MRLSVVIPTHDPRVDHLGETLEGLRRQALPTSEWELVLVDNGSEPAVASWVDLSWHASAAVVAEPELGLTRARLAGLRRASGDLIVLVDDDNVLAHDYLEQASRIALDYRFLGTWGGSIVPRFERPDLQPPKSLFPLLTLREASGDLWSNDPDHHASTPWGAGLCLRREVATEFVRFLAANPRGFDLDLQGKSLLYGGDTEIAYTGCRIGLGKGVFSALKVEHLIPATRCTREHLTRVADGRGYSEVLHHVVRSGTLPVERRSLGGWLRLQRAIRMGGDLERAVARARFEGRRRALAELGALGNRPS